VDFFFDVEKVLEPFFNGRVRDGEFEEYVSFLEICGCVMEFEVMDRKDVVGNEIVDESEHFFDRMRN